MSKWVIAQINGGKYGDGSKRLFSQEVHEEMWTPQTIIPVRGSTAYNTHFSAYGLGWFLSDVKGYKQATHSESLFSPTNKSVLLSRPLRVLLKIAI